MQPSQNPLQQIDPLQRDWLAFQQTKDGQGAYAFVGPHFYLRGTGAAPVTGAFASGSKAGTQVSLSMPLPSGQSLPDWIDLALVNHSGSAIGYTIGQTVTDFVLGTGSLVAPLVQGVAQTSVATPTTAPTPTAVAGSTALVAGTYTAAYSFVTADGLETGLSPTANVTLTAGEEIQVSAITLPTGAASVNYYLSEAAGSSTLLFDANGDGAQTDLTALPAATASAVPTVNQTGATTLVLANGAAAPTFLRFPYLGDGPLVVTVTLLSGNANPGSVGARLYWE